MSRWSACCTPEEAERRAKHNAWKREWRKKNPRPPGRKNPYIGTKLMVNVGEKNGQWRGDSVGYTALHYWVKRRLPKKEFCEACKVKPPLDLANKSQQYKRDIADWEWLCRRCHMLKDGRMKNLRRGRV